MKGRVLAVDYGGKRTGLALSDDSRIVATPIPAVVSSDLQETVEAITELVQEKKVTTVLIGMPYLPSGEEGEQCSRVRLFQRSLKETLAKDISMVEIDERFSTHEAASLLRLSGKKAKDLKKHLDSTAAVVLLREFLSIQPPAQDSL